MATLITINVKNNNPFAQKFFFFQQPAIYTGGAKVYSNSLYSNTLLPNAESGARLTFQLLLQYCAGAQSQACVPVVGQPCGQLSAIQPIDLTPNPTAATPTTVIANTTNMTVAPSLGLSQPTSTEGVQPGAFRIVVPTFDANVGRYSVGSAVTTPSGGITLSSFTSACPTTNIDCQPVLKFYVQTGGYQPGVVMNFTSSSIGAALCDATNGFTTFDVVYNSDGTWASSPA
ncbi:MAG: hypothetical protein WCC64_13225 [Aliidongia sp.]